MKVHINMYPSREVVKNPKIKTSAVNHHELLFKDTLLIQKQQTEVTPNDFSNPLYLFYV